MNSGRIKNSSGEINSRYQSILRVMMEYDYPPSGGEIISYIVDEIMRAHPNLTLTEAMKMAPQAISTTIGEMRSDENQNDGYFISNAMYWKVIKNGNHEPGRHVNKDGSVTFFINRATEPWHDSRPRYYLKAAPDWRARWYINDRGERIIGRSMPQSPPIIEDEPVKHPEPSGHECPGCGKMVFARGLYCPETNDECRKKHRQKYGIPDPVETVPAQGKLL